MTGALDNTSFNFTATSRNSDYDRQEPSNSRREKGAATRTTRTETTRAKTHKTEKDRKGKKGNPLVGHSHSIVNNHPIRSILHKKRPLHSIETI